MLSVTQLVNVMPNCLFVCLFVFFLSTQSEREREREREREDVYGLEISLFAGWLLVTNSLSTSKPVR